MSVRLAGRCIGPSKMPEMECRHAFEKHNSRQEAVQHISNRMDPLIGLSPHRSAGSALEWKNVDT